MKTSSQTNPTDEIRGLFSRNFIRVAERLRNDGAQPTFWPARYYHRAKRGRILNRIGTNLRNREEELAKEKWQRYSMKFEIALGCAGVVICYNGKACPIWWVPRQ